MSAHKWRLSFVAYAVALVFTGCTSSSTSTVQNTLVNQHLYVTTGGKVFVYNLPLTGSSVAAVTTGVSGFSGRNLCFDSAGHIFMPAGSLTSSSGAILAFALPLTATSAPVFTLSAPDIPTDCHFDPSGNMYVANQSARPSGVQVFRAPVQSGSAINSTIPAVAGSSGVWTDSSGGVYVSSGNGTGNILVYSSFATGNTLQATFGGGNSIAGTFGLALGPSGSLYVANGTSNGAIDVYDPPFTNSSTRNASKTTTLVGGSIGTGLDYLAFDKAGNMFVGVEIDYSNTGFGSSHIFVLQPPYKSVSVDLNLGFTGGVGLAVGP